MDLYLRIELGLHRFQFISEIDVLGIFIHPFAVC